MRYVTVSLTGDDTSSVLKHKGVISFQSPSFPNPAITKDAITDAIGTPDLEVSGILMKYKGEGTNDQ